MVDILPSSSLLAAFIAASFILAITPGPAVLYIVMRSLSQGRSSGFASVAGVALGNLGNMIGACIGLAALFSVSIVAFLIVKYLGALYLIFIGVQMLFESRGNSGIKTKAEMVRIPLNKIFRDGFLVALFNPKTALFFAAFLPQFLDVQGHHLTQSLFLGSLFVCIAAVTDTFYVCCASLVRNTLYSKKIVSSIGKTLSGIAFIGLGLITAFSGHKSQ